MKNYSALLLATVAAGFLSTPSFAQDKMMDMSTMTCADMMKMDKTGMMMTASDAEIMKKMDAMSDADKKAMTDKMATETTGMSDADKNAYHMKAMRDDMKAKMDKMSDADKATQMKMTEDTMMKMETACKGNDTMTMTDVMKSMK